MKAKSTLLALVLGTAAIGCAPAKHVYDIPNGECRDTSCGEVCYNGIKGGMISANINRESQVTGFPIENRLVYINGCELPVIDVDEGLLVVQNWKD